MGCRSAGRCCLILRALFLGGLLAGCATEVPVQRGQELAAAGRWEDAVRFYREAAARDPRDIEIRLGLARAMREAADALVTQAGQSLKAGQLDDAYEAYRRALGYDAENTAAQSGLIQITILRQVKDHLARAREHMEKGEWHAAQADVAAALRLDPDSAEVRAVAGQIADRLAAEAPPSSKSKGEMAAAQLFSTQPVTLRFRDTDIKEVLEVFARTAGINIIADESLPTKRITTFFKDVPLREAFNLILIANRLFAKTAADNTVIVIPDNPGKRQQYDELMVRTFYLTDTDAKVAVNLLRTILNTRQVFVNEKLNALVVRDTPEKIELAQKLLAANDRAVGEVEIDLEVLEVDRNSLQDLGIDLNPRTYSVTLGFPQNMPIGGIWNSVRYGSVVTIDNPALVLNLVKNDGNTKTLANPTICILDRQKARLLVGERYPFQISSISSVPAVATTSATGTTTATTASTTTQTNVEYRDLGLKLTLTPIVHLNGEVTVELSFEMSSLGAPIAGVQGGQLLPPVNTRNLDTFIKVKNGETRLLGGLFQNYDSVANSEIPFLSDIPWLGRLFISGDHNKTTTDVLISLTPRIVKMLDRPDPRVESFVSGTGDSFGPSAGTPSALAPPPVQAPGPARSQSSPAPAPGPQPPPSDQ